MAFSDELNVVNKAFSGLGIDEKSLISILGKWDTNQLKSFRLRTPHFFGEDDRSFEKLVQNQINLLKFDFLRFKTAMVLWTMHPWERDARLINDALLDGPKSNNVIIEIACTRSSDELLGARRAYHSLFERSIEEDVASHVTTDERKLFVALVSAYRYEGPKVNEEVAKSEAKILYSAVKNADKKNPLLDDDVVTILSTRSKSHIKSLFKYYVDLSGSSIDVDLDINVSLKDTIQCLCTPPTYFCKVMETAMAKEVDENTREGLTRVIVTRADIDMKLIKEEYRNKYTITLSEKIEDVANGNYKDFLLTLIAREENK
ncbi:annexin D4 [Rutidosis leptorrhynchoides]|uniref:annexin D4 n=1 Tax=Rutidosis leptorrhynchoides TaxID=125765 RepID=UPI003A98E878